MLWTQLFINCSSHSKVLGPNCLICSVRRSSIPGALFGFVMWMADLSSTMLKRSLSWLVSSSLMTNFSFLFVPGAFPFLSSWDATWFAVTFGNLLFLSVGSWLRFFKSCHAGLLFCAMFKFSKRLHHLDVRSSAMAVRSLSPASCVSSLKGSSS
uniref:Uncharacterized protein n=1 Tax=Cacopsylla melanoneura TaxID=428564 RepID=A0A8D8Y359_9HEMI